MGQRGQAETAASGWIKSNQGFFLSIGRVGPHFQNVVIFFPGPPSFEVKGVREDRREAKGTAETWQDS